MMPALTNKPALQQQYLAFADPSGALFERKSKASGYPRRQLLSVDDPLLRPNLDGIDAA